jgi:DNA repair exonuclease SbcCD ATPase subunit
MKNIFMVGAICALVFSGLNAYGNPKAGTCCHHEHHAGMKKLHEEMKGQFEALNGMREDIAKTVAKNDDKGAVEAIYAFLNAKHELCKDLHEKSKKHHEEMHKKHMGKEHDANLKKHHEGMKKLHEEMKTKFAELDAILESIKDAADKGDVKEAVEKISEYLDQKHELAKEFHDKSKKQHEEMRKKNAGKVQDVQHKKHHEWMKKAHADMHENFAALDETRDAIQAAVKAGKIHDAIVAISKYLDEKHELIKSFHENMKKHHEEMHKKFCGKGKCKFAKKNVKSTPEVEAAPAEVAVE